MTMPRSAFPLCRRALAALSALCMLFVAPWTLAQQPVAESLKIPVADFFRTPRLDQPALSPSGRHVAAGVSIDGGRVQLAVFDLETAGQSKIIARLDDADVHGLAWVNDERLVFSAIDRESSVIDRPIAPGLWAVNRDGSGFRQLIGAARNLGRAMGGRTLVVDDNRLLGPEWRLHSLPRDGSNDVLVLGVPLKSSAAVVGVKLARLDTTTGLTRYLGDGAPDYVTRWVVDRRGLPAALTTLHEGRFRSYLRSADDKSWEKWQDAEAIGGSYVIPYWVDFDGKLLALGRRVDDTHALYIVDTRTREIEPEPMINLKGYDFTGDLVMDPQARRLLGVHYETDGYGTAWLDPVMRSTQAAVDALLPATANRIDCQRCTSVPTVLVTAVSDRQPRFYYLYNRETRSLVPVGASRPWIKAQSMGRRDVHRFAARDGLSIPVLVTFPPGSAATARPAVVLVHGGPWVRGTHWEWEPQAQFLASRGYVVIEPEFRGSDGYGFRHSRAGWKQWGLAMQDDVADAVQWAVKQGWVDSRRVCIAGASYGGYATLMGLVRHHELYRCGVEWVGVTDINLMYSAAWNDISDEARGYRMPALIGDPVTDAQQLKDTSPLVQASKVRRPLLMAYGGHDLRVPVEHGKEFRDAVGPANKDVEFVVYADEGHGWRMLETNVDFWTRVEKFLERHLGPDAK